MAVKGRYGEGSEVTRDQNPLGLKLTQLPEEKMCALCHSKADVIFPITDMVLCFKHANIMAEYKDVKVVFYPYSDLRGVGHCAVCGEQVVMGVKANTHICNKCTRELGRKEQAWRIKDAAHARKPVKSFKPRKVL